MASDLRPSPKFKPVSLFVTCIVDAIYPQTGVSVVEILEHLGVEVRFPMGQTCCGQTGYNSGFWEDARAVAKQFLRAFADAEVIVTPSPVQNPLVSICDSGTPAACSCAVNVAR